MATKKRKKSKPQRATRGALRADSDSAAAGEQLAKQALAFRAKQRRIRKQREAELDRKRARARAPSRARSAAAASSVALPAAQRALFGARSSEGTLIAEGDSWFDYPGNGVLRLLEDEHLFDVESVARAGDRIEDMAHTGGLGDASTLWRLFAKYLGVTPADYRARFVARGSLRIPLHSSAESGGT
jgi:AraC-like DNA-binding protein